VLRDGWSPSATWALVDGGPHGSLNCGHAHADALAVEVAANGRPVLTDSGTFCYTGVERERFRASASHNTATVDGESSSLTGGLFHWRHVAQTTVHAWLTSSGADFWRGSHDGFARLPDPAVHERSLLLVRGRYLVVLDTLDAAGAHELTVHWHCAPDLAFVPSMTTLTRRGSNCGSAKTQVAPSSPTLRWISETRSAPGMVSGLTVIEPATRMP